MDLPIVSILLYGARSTETAEKWKIRASDRDVTTALISPTLSVAPPVV